MLDIEIFENDCSAIKRKKKSLLEKFKVTQTKQIEEANLLAVYLLSLGRKKEAKKLLLSYACNIPYSETYFERWEAACMALMLLSGLESTEEAKRLRSIMLKEEVLLTEGPKISLFFSFLKQYESDLREISEDIPKGESLKLYGYYFQLFKYYIFVAKEFDFKECDIKLAKEKQLETSESICRLL